MIQKSQMYKKIFIDGKKRSTVLSNVLMSTTRFHVLKTKHYFMLIAHICGFKCF